MEALNFLIESSITVLKLLEGQYMEKKILYDDFKKHTQIKIKFLKYNIDSIQSPQEKADALNLLARCMEILEQGAEK